MTPAEFAASYQETAARFQNYAVGCLDSALSQDDATQRAALLKTAQLWLALSALAKKLCIR